MTSRILSVVLAAAMVFGFILAAIGAWTVLVTRDLGAERVTQCLLPALDETHD